MTPRAMSVSSEMQRGLLLLNHLPGGHRVERGSDGLGRDEAEGRGGHGDADALEDDREDLQAVDGAEVGLLGRGVHAVDDGDGQRAHDHREEEAGHRQRHGERDGRVDGIGRVDRAAVEREHHDDGGRDGGERGVGRHGGADVGPAEGDHLERAAQHDALREVPAHQPDERARHERLVELELVEDALHARQERDEDDEQNRDW